MQGNVALRGRVGAKLNRAEKAPLSWTLRNRARPGFVSGWFNVKLARAFSKLTGIPTLTSELKVRAYLGGRWVDYGTVSYRLITDTGVAFLVDDWTNDATDMTTMKYHGVGTGTGAEAVGDTALGTESTTILTVDSTRATGTQTQPSAWILQSVGTVSFDGSGAITEHGILSQAATGGGVLWDRSKFDAINVASGDSIQFTYQCTVSSGG